MFVKRRPAALAAVIAAVAVGAPMALASPTTSQATDPVVTGPSCPDGYRGQTNLATGCPYWMMSYTVKYAGESPLRCPVNWSAREGVAAPSASGTAAGAAERAVHGCSGVVPPT